MVDFAKSLLLLEKIDKQYKKYKQNVNETLILESDSRLKIAERIIEERFGNILDVNEVVNDEEYYIHNNPNTTWKEYIMYDLRHTFELLKNSEIKYIPVVARLAFSDEIQFDMISDEENGKRVIILQKIVQELKKDDNLFKEVQNNPNITFEQLVQRLNKTFENNENSDSEEANNVKNIKTDYIVQKVPNFRVAQYYGKYSCSSSQLCYTTSESIWNKYTQNDNNVAYVCLKKGFENIPEKPTDGYPYDLYGTSVIFAFIAPDKSLYRCNLRWNHHSKDYNIEHAFTKTELAQIVGKPFDSVFKPKD